LDDSFLTAIFCSGIVVYAIQVAVFLTDRPSDFQQLSLKIVTIPDSPKMGNFSSKFRIF